METLNKRKKIGKKTAKDCNLQQDASLEETQDIRFSKGISWMHAPFLQFFTPFHIVLILRVATVLVVNTYYVPDEYWQALEVAHHQVFGYGYLTWEWEKAIRNYFYPSIFALIYRILMLFHLDSLYSITHIPRFFQATLTVAADFYTYHLAILLFGNRAGKYALFFQISSWFLFYTGSRTLSNTMEMSLSIIGLFYVISNKINSTKRHHLYIGMALGITSCLVRPTAGIMWLPIISYVALNQRKWSDVLSVCLGATLTTSVVFGLSFCIDMYFYDKPVIPSLNFLKFNILQNLSGFYGSHPWHWYLLQGIPVTFGPQILPTVVGIWRSWRKADFLLTLIFLEVGILSLITHKEFRFLLPILPICFCFAGEGAVEITDFVRNKSPIFRQFWKLFLLFSIITNCMIGLYTSIIHQRGVLDAVNFLARKATKDPRSSFLFLMPCHSTPYYSHIHMNVSMRFLQCHPNFTPGYREEADVFYENPNHWLDKEYRRGAEKTIPTDVILFDPLQKEIQPFLTKLLFKECAKFFHTHFPSGRVGTHVLIYSRQSAAGT